MIFGRDNVYSTSWKRNVEVSAMGLGCWAIGGPWTYDNEPAGWSQVDDAESIRAIHYALDSGINFFDTSPNYGCGRSERALAGRSPAGATGLSWLPCSVTSSMNTAAL